MSPLKKSAQRPVQDRQRAKVILKSLSEESSETYERYRAFYKLWCSNSSALPELKPLFRIPGIEPDGAFAISNELHSMVHALAAEALSLMSASEVGRR
jgi:hypothetical protein